VSSAAVVICGNATATSVKADNVALVMKCILVLLICRVGQKILFSPGFPTAGNEFSYLFSRRN
jgi:hypothetical protein